MNIYTYTSVYGLNISPQSQKGSQRGNRRFICKWENGLAEYFYEQTKWRVHVTPELLILYIIYYYIFKYV